MAQENVMGRVYIIRFIPQFKHAWGYIGWTTPNGLFKRLEKHRKGQGARITAAAIAAGCRLELVYDAPGTRGDERAMKRWGNCRRVVASLERKGQLNSQRVTLAYKHGRNSLPAPLTLDELMED